MGDAECATLYSVKFTRMQMVTRTGAVFLIDVNVNKSHVREMK